MGLPNPRHVVCKFCKKILIPEGSALKVYQNVRRHLTTFQVDMIRNHMREYDKMNTYWHVDSIDKFSNVEIHGIMGDIKYLCCISC